MSKNKKINQKLIIANWKMNPSTLKEAKKLFRDFRNKKTINKNVTTVFCPPVTFLGEIKKLYRGQKIFFGAQDIFYETEGPFTGEISADMIKDLGGKFVIIGHSERRLMGDTDEIVSKKLLTSLHSGFHSVLCVGEKERDTEGKYLLELSQQIINSLQNVPKELLKKMIIAYEPIWAVGKGNKAMDPKEMHFMSLFIKKQLIKIYDRKSANLVTILYGGSVDSDNAVDFVKESDVNGLLIGRASLNPFEFSKIITNVSSSM